MEARLGRGTTQVPFSNTVERLHLSKLLLVNLCFFMGRIYWSVTEQHSALYTETNFSMISADAWSKIDKIIFRKLTKTLRDNLPGVLFQTKHKCS